MQGGGRAVRRFVNCGLGARETARRVGMAVGVRVRVPVRRAPRRGAEKRA